MEKEKGKLSVAIIIALLFSFCGGYVEFWSVTRHGIFSGMETGNLITGVISWTDGDYREMTYRFLAVGLFFLVSLLCDVIRRLLEKKNLREDVLMLALSAANLFQLRPFLVNPAPIKQKSLKQTHQTTFD